MSGKVFALAAVISTVVASFKEGCDRDSWNSTTDYWQHKFDPNDPYAAFVADYHNTFATLRNHAGYTVLHCTDEKPPLSAIGGEKDALYVKVPVQNVAALDGFSQNLIDMLGQSDSIKRVGKYEDVTSACLRGLAYDNKTYDEANWDKAEKVDVTFYGNGEPNDMSKVLLYPHLNSPLGTLSYIKMISLFYGLEERAEEIYEAVAANYRCAAANVQDYIMNHDYPEGAFLSFVEKKGDDFVIRAGDYWQILADDAGVRLVNATNSKLIQDEYEGSYWQINLSKEESEVAKQSWAIIDTTQYLASSNAHFSNNGHKGFPDRLNAKTYLEKSGLDGDLYAFKKENVFLTDKATNRNLKHDFNDRGAARPDYVLFDLISKIKPEMTKGIYKTNFLRSISNPEDETEQLSDASVCYPSDSPIKTLNITKCTLPKWAAGYHSLGVEPNAFNRKQNTVKSLALRSDSGGLSGGTKAGISVGAIVGGLLVIGGVITVILYRRRSVKKTKEGPDMEKCEEQRKDSQSSSSI
ncbi:hypothetical protein Plec18167_005969 [Paecilomyces lecythidis]|uniref:Periplasmic binding protein n=1 Tax=Paecilomyces lecythidis TaxID=3004212 RepID=A0ABR3XDP8_9EURO